MNNFVIYSKEGCSYCDKIRQVLKLTNQNYRTYELGVDFQKEEFYNEFGEGSTLPQIICNGKILGGCNETIQWLREQKVIQ